MTRQYNNHGRDQINIEQVKGDVILHQQQSARPPIELLLLQEVEREANSRLEQSLHNMELITLNKQAQPKQVKRLWDAEVKVGAKETFSIPLETSILEVFQQTEIANRLLILGEPGSGKTTTVLELATALIEKAKQNIASPIPILLNLSSWQNPRQIMADWIVKELNSKYGVRRDLAKKLVKEQQLLPILDGLDEVKPEHQEACINAINQWLESESRPLSIVVCSRKEEYASYESRLFLNGAILLQPLTDKQIQTFLYAIQQIELWQLLEQDDALLELVKTPLFLSITVLSYKALSFQQWQQLTSTEQRVEMLLDTYVQKMLGREIDSRAYKAAKLPSEKQTRCWLINLAQQMQKESQTEFLIEKMQPFWLQARAQKRLYRASLGIIVGLLVGVTGGIWFNLMPSIVLGITEGTVEVPIIGLVYGLKAAFIQGLNGALMYGVLMWLTEGITSGLICGSIYGLIRGLLEVLLVLSGVIEAGERQIGEIVLGALGSGLILGLIFGLLAKFGVGDTIRPFETLNLSEPKARRKVVYGLLSGLLIWLFVLTIRLFSGEEIRLDYELTVALSFSLIGGAMGALWGLRTRPEIRIREIPNQGIWHSITNAVFLTLISSLILGLITTLVTSGRPGIDNVQVLNLSLILAGIGGIIGGLIPGIACIQHLALRIVLYRKRVIPWDYARFLNHATKQHFLQQIGGRYRFVHALLQQHFTHMSN